MLRNDNKTHKTVYAYTNSPSSFRCSNSQTIVSYGIVLLCSHRSLFSVHNTCCYRTTMRIRLATSSVYGRCTRKIPLPRWWWLDDDGADADNGNDEVNGENRAKWKGRERKKWRKSFPIKSTACSMFVHRITHALDGRGEEWLREPLRKREKESVEK